MSAETKKVLEMLQEGKITSDDAERLLDKLGSTKPEEEPGHGAASKERSTNNRFLRVHVDTFDGDNVNVKIPLSFLRSGVRLLGMLPKPVAEKLANQGLNLDFLSTLKGEELDAALNAIHVEVETDDGEHVQVFCE